MPTVIVCDLDSASDIVGRKRTYAAVKARILECGRFSVFEACESAKNARLFERLCKDPGVEVFELASPWTGVRKRVANV